MIDRRRTLLAGLTGVMVARHVAARPSRQLARVGILNYAAAQDTRVAEFRAALAG